MRDTGCQHCCIHFHGNTVTSRAPETAKGQTLSYEMDLFVVHFDLFGGLSLDEWLEEDGKKNQIRPSKKERFVRVSNEELNQLERSRNELTTSRSTSWVPRLFPRLSKNHGEKYRFCDDYKKESLTPFLVSCMGPPETTRVTTTLEAAMSVWGQASSAFLTILLSATPGAWCKTPNSQHRTTSSPELLNF